MSKHLNGPLFAAAGVIALAVAGMSAARAQDITIGLNMVKSGALKNLGEATETSVDIAVDEINAKGGINGHKLKVIKYDTGSDPKQAATATQKFAQDDGALAVIGPFSSGEAAVAFPVGERLGIVQIPNAARNSRACSTRSRRKTSRSTPPRSCICRTNAWPTFPARSSIRAFSRRRA